MSRASAASGPGFSLEFGVPEHISCGNWQRDSRRGLCSISVTPFWLPTKRRWQSRSRLGLMDVGLGGLANMPVISTFYHLFFGLLILIRCQRALLEVRGAKQVKAESWL